MPTTRRLATIAFRGQFWAAAVLPLCLVAGSILAGGGLLMAGFTFMALPVAAFLALGPSLGSWLGKMHHADDVPLPYALVTIALWVAVLPVGFLTTYGQDWPSYAEAPPGNALADALGGVAVTTALLLWPVQLVLAIVGVRARRGARRHPRLSARVPGT